MKSVTYLFSVVPLVLGAAFPSPSSKPETYTFSSCVTRYGTSSLRHVPTRSEGNTRTFVSYQTVTSTPSTTVTPARPTTTTTATRTKTATITAPQSTDTTTVSMTVTTTETDTSTTTMTDTETDTATSTTVVSTTSTVPAASGFTPVADVPSVESNGGGTEYPNTKRSFVEQLERRTSNASSARAAVKHPEQVICYHNVRVYEITTETATGKKTSTITASTPPPATKTTHIIDTATTTVTPADTTVTASSTSTSTTTSTSTSTADTTVTTTSTSTYSSYVTIGTAYAACSGDNEIDAVGGSIITDFNRPNAGFFSGISGADSPQACCISCQGTSGCLGYGYSLSGIDFGCLLVVDTVDACDASTSTWQFFHDSASGQVVVGDGPCGQGTYTS